MADGNEYSQIKMNTNSNNQSYGNKIMSIKNTIFAILGSIYMRSTKKRLKPEFPKILGGYSYSHQIKANSYNNYAFAIYKNMKGQRAIAKLWQGHSKNYSYLLLKNEATAIPALISAIQRIDKMPSKFANFEIVEPIMSEEYSDRLILLKKFINGKSGESLEPKNQIKLFQSSSDFIAFLGKNLNIFEKSIFSKRTPVKILAIYPLLLVVATLRNREYFRQLFMGLIAVIKSIPLFIKESALVLSDRDLSPSNFIIKNNKMYLIDLQFSMFSNHYYDSVYRTCIQWRQKNLRQPLSKFILNLAKSHKDKRFVLLKGLSTIVMTHYLAVGQNKPSDGIADFYNTFISGNPI